MTNRRMPPTGAMVGTLGMHQPGYIMARPGPQSAKSRQPSDIMAVPGSRPRCDSTDPRGLRQNEENLNGGTSGPDVGHDGIAARGFRSNRPRPPADLYGSVGSVPDFTAYQPIPDATMAQTRSGVSVP